MNTFTLHHGDCLDMLKTLPENSVDSIVTDPPYGLSFMGKKWDYDVPSQEIWQECLRVLKPGGHLLAFAGTRTQHRMAVRIEDAGFEIRDMIAWVYGSGFPKSHDVSKGIDKAAGAVREILSKRPASGIGQNGSAYGGHADGAEQKFDAGPVTQAAQQWQGWGTALKPALEPITVARKPLIGTVAENVLEHGTGALNIDASRVGRDADDVSGWSQTGSKAGENRSMSGANYAREAKPDAEGRWPANFIHDGSDEVNDLLMETARFFYCAKASKKDRDEGLEGFDEKKMGFSNGAQIHGEGYDKGQDIGLNRVVSRKNIHPTVKPTDLMRYLCRLVTQPGGTVLDPFMGSGSTGKAAMLEGFNFIGIEREKDFYDISHARISSAVKDTPEVKQTDQPTLFEISTP